MAADKDTVRSAGGADPIRDADATQTLYLHPAAAEEIRRLMGAHGWTAGAALEAAWELAKAALHEERDHEGNRLSSPPPRDPPAGICAEARPLEPLAEPGGREPVRVEAAVRSEVMQEVSALARHLDRSLSWVVNRAWGSARDRIVR
jgi:hypothetical protein